MSEYEMLREEMMQCYKDINLYNTTLYSVTAVLFVFVWNTDNYILSMIPLIVIIPLYLLCEGSHHKICYIAAYMFVFLEGKQNNWEQRHQIFDTFQYNKKDKWNRWDMVRMIPYYTLVFLCCGMTIYKCLKINCYSVKSVVISFFITCIGCVCFYILKRYTVKYSKVKSAYIKQWRYMLMHHMIK